MTDDLAALAETVRKSLHWCVFLVGAMGLILVIDLQIKRSIARQAVSFAAVMHRAGTDRLRADLIGGKSEREPVDSPADDSDHPGGDGGHHVDGSAGMAAGDSTPRSAGKEPRARRAAGPPDGSPGDG